MATYCHTMYITNSFQGCLIVFAKNSIDHIVCLVAYNKEDIKQYGCCMLKVNYRDKTMLLPFYIVNSKFKPIIGLDASCKLGSVNHLTVPSISLGLVIPLRIPPLTLFHLMLILKLQ